MITFLNCLQRLILTVSFMNIPNEDKILSYNKNLSTSQSHNSTNQVLDSQRQNPNGYRLFTFMNVKDSPPINYRYFDQNMKPYEKQSDQPKLVDMIEKSRKRRESYLNQIQMQFLNKPLVKKSKTPMNSNKNLKENKSCRKIKKDTVKLNKSTINTNCNINRSPYTPKSCTNKMSRTKSSIGGFKATINDNNIENVLKHKHSQVYFGQKVIKNCIQLDSTQKLLEKKKKLEKQLQQINESLLMKKKKKSNVNGALKTKRRAF